MLTYWLGEYGSWENVATDMSCFIEQFRVIYVDILENEGAGTYLFVVHSLGNCTWFTTPMDRGDLTSINTTEQRGVQSEFTGMRLEKSISPTNRH
jgi:hypothetical protein